MIEKLTFGISMRPIMDREFHKVPPVVSIYVNDGLCKMLQPVDKHTTFVFDYECGEHNTLMIRYHNKSREDVVLDDVGGIAKDKRVGIEKIVIDGVNITNLATITSVYTPTDQWYVDDPNLDTALTNHMDLGFNGDWKFSFDTPFYLWLLENM